MLRSLVIALLLSASMWSPAHAERRVALVIGNSAYRSAAALDNPVADAKLMADTLRSLGFFVVGGGAKLDLDKVGFDKALGEFGQALAGADVALFYYAGHGIESHGFNYLVPIDANPKSEADVPAQMTGLADILGQMEKSHTSINLLLLDACRDNPFRDAGMRSAAAGGLVEMEARPGTLISFATQPHGVSLDGDDGHSPYTRALADTMKQPGFGLFKTFNEVGLAVQKATHGEQLPWVSTSPIAGHFYFAGKPVVAALAPETARPADPATPSARDDPRLRRELITDCDRLAAMPYDSGHATELPGVDLDKINIPLATAACDDAMRRYPDVARFEFEAGRVAQARKDYAEARRLFDQAAAGGYAMAFNNIGFLYGNGQGTRADFAQAATWFKKAADAGEPVAMQNLGVLFLNAQGMKKDCAEAVRLFETAVNAGLPAAMDDLGQLYLRGQCVGRDYAEAQRLFQQGSALGLAAAMNDMGVIFGEGDGVPRDVRIARQWYEKAAALGNPAAKQNLSKMRR